MPPNHPRVAIPTNELAFVHQGLIDGRVTFMYQANQVKGPKLRVALEATREEATWRLVMTTGDGQKVEKVVPAKDIERELTESVLVIRNWFVERTASKEALS